MIKSATITCNFCGAREIKVKEPRVAHLMKKGGGPSQAGMACDTCYEKVQSHNKPLIDEMNNKQKNSLRIATEADLVDNPVEPTKPHHEKSEISEIKESLAQLAQGQNALLQLLAERLAPPQAEKQVNRGRRSSGR